MIERTRSIGNNLLLEKLDNKVSGSTHTKHWHISKHMYGSRVFDFYTRQLIATGTTERIGTVATSLTPIYQRLLKHGRLWKVL